MPRCGCRILAPIACMLALFAPGLCARVACGATANPPAAPVAGPAVMHAGDPAPLIGRRDVLFALATVGAVALVAPADPWLTRESDQLNGQGGRTLAHSAQPLGNGAYVLPAIAAGWLAARASGHDLAAGSFVRIGISVGAAGAGALALKEITGRPRPIESPNESDDLHPFSGHASFPSGHAAISFALATAISRESSWSGTPWIVYPLATLVGWSRVHDHAHWTSDVIAGAALGTWTAHKVEDVLQPERPQGSRLGLGWVHGGPAVAVRF